MAVAPVQTVKQRFGDKKKLAEELSGVLKRSKGESKDDFVKKLMKVSNKKLLRLYDRAKSGAA